MVSKGINIVKQHRLSLTKTSGIDCQRTASYKHQSKNINLRKTSINNIFFPGASPKVLPCKFKSDNLDLYLSSSFVCYIYWFIGKHWNNIHKIHGTVLLSDRVGVFHVSMWSYVECFSHL